MYKAIPRIRFKALKNLYKLELLKAKQDSWRNVCAESTKITPWKMYKVCKAGFTRQPLPSLLNLIRKGDCKSPPPKVFFYGSTAQDSGKQRNIRAQIRELGPRTPK
jgi:hypothetical protein